MITLLMKQITRMGKWVKYERFELFASQETCKSATLVPLIQQIYSPIHFWTEKYIGSTLYTTLNGADDCSSEIFLSFQV